MKILRPKNTKEKGTMEFFAYPERGRFIGICLTFDIVEEGESINSVMELVKKAAILHLRTVIEKDLDDELLNRYAPSVFWEKYFEHLEEMEQRNIEQMRIDLEVENIIKENNIDPDELSEKDWDDLEEEAAFNIAEDNI